MISSVNASTINVLPIRSKLSFTRKTNNSSENNISAGKKIAGFGVGAGICSLVFPFKKQVGKFFITRLLKNEETIPFKTASKAANEFVEKSKLPKDFTYSFVNQFNRLYEQIFLEKSLKSKKQFAKLDDLILKNPKLKQQLPEGFTGLISNIIVNTVASGKNAFYVLWVKKAFAPSSMPSLIFHEIGHAINSQKLITKIMMKTRLASKILPPLIAINVLTHKRKPEEGRSKLGKVNDFVKNHCGLVTFAAFAPILCEELIASTRGLNFLKNSKDISKPMLNSVRKKYALAFSTYAALAVANIALIKAASIVRDKIVYKDCVKN